MRGARVLIALVAAAVLGAPFAARVEAQETSKQRYYRQRDRFEKEQAAREIAEQIERYRQVQGELEAPELERIEEDARLNAIEKYEGILERVEAVDEPDLEDILHRLAVLYAEHEAGQHRRGHDLLEEEKRLYKAGIIDEPPPIQPDFRRAKRLYRILLDRFPDSKYAEEAMYFIGYATEEEEGMEAALPYYDVLLRTYPKGHFTTEVQMRLGEYYFFLDDFARARTHYGQVVAAGPSEFLEKGLFKLGWTHFIQGSHAQARETFLSLLDEFAANPKEPRGELFRETVEALAKSYAEDSSEEELKAIAARSGATGYGITIYQALADLYREQSRYGDAVSVYSYLLATYPTYERAPEVMATYIDSLSVEKRLDEANELREKMITAYGPGSPWWQANPNNEERVKALAISQHMLTVVTQYYHGKAQRDGQAADWANALRLYRKFLASFPDSPAHIEARYNYSQALYDTKDYVEAITQFGEVARHPGFPDKPNPYVEKAAYFRVLAVNEMAKTRAVPVDLTIQVYGDYIALNPKSERVPQLLFKQGEILYNAKAYRRAAIYFDQLATEHPNDSRAKEAHLLATQAFFQAEDYPAVERRARFNLARLPLTPEEREKQERMVALSMFKSAEGLEAAGDSLAAANRFADLYTEFPGRDVAPNALYNAGQTYRRLGRKSEALAAFETLVRKHQDSTYAFDALLLAVAIHEEDDNWRAVEDKLDIAERLAPKRPEVREIAWRLAEWAGAKGTRADAARLYGRYRDRYPGDTARNLTGEYRIFVKDFEALPKDATEGPLTTLRNRFDVLRSRAKGHIEVDRFYEAALRYRIAEIRFDDYRRIRFVRNVERNLKNKTAALKSLTREYIAIAELGFKDFRSAAGYRVGAVHEDFFRALMDSPVPKELTDPEEVAMYRSILAKKAEPYRKEAVLAYEAVVAQTTGTAVHDKWTAQAQIKLAILDPLHHQPLEMEVRLPAPVVRAYDGELEILLDKEVPYAQRLTGAPLADLERRFDAALATFEGNRDEPAAARDQFLAMLDTGADYPAIDYNLGVLFQREENLPLAEQYYRRALALAPDWERPLANLGALLVTAGRCDEAVRPLERATEKAGGKDRAYLNWGLALECQEDLQGATAIYDIAAALPYPSASLMLARGKLAYRRGDRDKAAQSFQAILSAELPDPASVMAVAEFFEDQGETAAAEVAYQRAIAEPATTVAAGNNLGLLLRRAGAFDKARGAYYKALERDSRAAAVHNNLGVLAAIEGKSRLALTNYEKALTIAPNLTETLFNVGILYELHLEQAKRAEPYYQRYLEAGGTRLDHIKGLAEIREDDRRGEGS